MEGESRITLMDRPEDAGKHTRGSQKACISCFSDESLFVFAEYVLTMPNMYARGILFGKMVIELGDTCTVRNAAQDLHADIEFKTKGFFSGTYNAIAGRVRHGSTELGEVTGKWSALMEFKTAKVRLLTLNQFLPCSRPTQLTIYLVDVCATSIIFRLGTMR
jgi:hypothetical protein